MSFTSIYFWIFFIIVVVAVGVTNASAIKNRLSSNTLFTLRHMILLIASYFFYAWWDWRFCILMLFLSSNAYLSARMIAAGKHEKLFTFLGVAFPLMVLGVFKYFDFFVDTFCEALGIADSLSLHLILPVGISFYTFQSISYIIDVRRGSVPAENSFIKVALYISFFPQLVAGPIVKAKDFLPQLYEARSVTWAGAQRAIPMILMGLFKKVVIADHLSVFVDSVFDKPAVYDGATVVLAIVSYSIQIYFDFSGYSDIALGCAKFLGYDLKPNFNIPYIAKNPSEFWKRWHISLSTWLKEYLYIPLGGNRRGKFRTYINLLVTMLLGGLWHGANLTFVFWGLLHGIGLCVHKALVEKKAALGATTESHTRKSGPITSFFSILATYVFVCFCWVFFRAQDFGEAIAVLRRIPAWNDGVTHAYFWSIVAIIVLIVGTFTAIAHARRTLSSGRGGVERVSGSTHIGISGYYPELDLSKFSSLVIVFFTLGMILVLAYTGASPFIYFQF
jgi:alginate O-acetyltransferase complex protein AlgI